MDDIVKQYITRLWKVPKRELEPSSLTQTTRRRQADTNEMADATACATARGQVTGRQSLVSTARHWRVLRNALLAKTRDEASDATASSISTEFFPQFASERVDDQAQLTHKAESNFEWHAYAIQKRQTGHEATKRVLVHEKLKRKRVTIEELFSHKLNAGVDNTGNIRTWPSEQILLAHLIKNETVSKMSARLEGRRIRCCELGAGMGGLASLGLMAHDSKYIASMLVTDGNAQSAENLAICVEENVAQGVVPRGATSAELLRWDREASFDPSLQYQFDLLLASDCLFFEDFHEDLAHTIKQLLRPETGVCLLMQPSRNGSMERFCAIAAQRYGLTVEIQHDFDAALSRQHAQYTRTHCDSYIPDVHRPILVVLTSPLCRE